MCTGRKTDQTNRVPVQKPKRTNPESPDDEMLDQRRAVTSAEDMRAELFTERYKDLLAWALRLTNQNHEAAEDLVQDAFVQFMVGRTGLEQIDNIDGYLRGMLCNMHASRMSREAQYLHDTLSIDDDSLAVGWPAIEPARRIQAFEELQQVCAYACARKESSRAGSVLILRYFHDYCPSEIASVICSSRHCVDQWQSLARGEVKQFINDPGRLRFVAAKHPVERCATRSVVSMGDPMSELRQMIFCSCRGPCLAHDELHEIYTLANTQALTTMKLAHIVSCHSCLDAVNGLLGLPRLAQRSQPEPSNAEPAIATVVEVRQAATNGCAKGTLDTACTPSVCPTRTNLAL